MSTPEKPKREWLSLAIVLLVTLGGLYLVLVGTRSGNEAGERFASARDQASANPARAAPLKSDIAPAALYAVSYPGMDGAALALGKWQGKVIVLNFWATWCVPCREEMPIFERVHKKLEGQGVVVVGLAADDRANIEPFLQTSPVAYPVLVGEFEALEFARRLGNPHGALPYTVIIDRAGNIVRTKLGPYTEAELEAQVKTAL